jgi:hypothetical protein
MMLLPKSILDQRLSIKVHPTKTPTQKHNVLKELDSLVKDLYNNARKSTAEEIKESIDRSIRPSKIGRKCFDFITYNLGLFNELDIKLKRTQSTLFHIFYAFYGLFSEEERKQLTQTEHTLIKVLLMIPWESGAWELNSDGTISDSASRRIPLEESAIDRAIDELSLPNFINYCNQTLVEMATKLDSCKEIERSKLMELARDYLILFERHMDKEGISEYQRRMGAFQPDLSTSGCKREEED